MDILRAAGECDGTILTQLASGPEAVTGPAQCTGMTLATTARVLCWRDLQLIRACWVEDSMIAKPQ
jgi:hypothetical protein